MKALLALLCIAGASHAAPPDWQYHPGKPGMPAVLLIHGLAASKTHWTEPGATWSIKNARFDHRKKVGDRDGNKKGVTKLGVTAYPVLAGVESFRVSPVDDDAGKKGSFWAHLVAEGYTVATWNQVPCMDSDKMPSQACKDKDTFAPAYATAKEALAELAKLSGVAPIALVGHSRGGLIARGLLKETALPGRDRVRWLITLHSPHQGSGMATMGVGLQKTLSDLDQAVDLDFLPKELRKPAKAMLPDLGDKLNGSIDALVAITGMEGARELAANGSVLAGLRKGESKPANIRSVTFGGTSPRIAELYAFVYDASSALPTKKGWKTDKHKLLDFPDGLPQAFAEMKEGGDLLVTDAASELPWQDLHISHALNHAEVLWSNKAQKEVHEQLKIKP